MAFVLLGQYMVFSLQFKNEHSLKALILFLSLTFSTSLFCQDLIKWYTWEEGMMKAEESPKKFIVDLYTKWCGWCKRMDKATFQNPDIANYINENYIPIKFNAEQKTEIEFDGEVHKFVKRGRGYHSLAAYLTGGKLSYPTVVFMDEEKGVIQAIPGFLDVDTLDPILRYFSDDWHKTTPWATYISEYKNGMAPSDKKKNNHSRLVNSKKGGDQ